MRARVAPLLLFCCLGLSCSSDAGSRAAGPPRREYALPRNQVRVAVLDTLHAMAMPVETQRGDAWILTEWTRVGGGAPEKVRLRIELRGGGDRCVALAQAEHLVEVRHGLRTEWEQRPSYGRLEREFLDRLDTRCGVVK